MCVRFAAETLAPLTRSIWVVGLCGRGCCFAYRAFSHFPGLALSYGRIVCVREGAFGILETGGSVCQKLERFSFSPSALLCSVR